MALIDFLSIPEIKLPFDPMEVMKKLRPSRQNKGGLDLNIMMVGGRRCGKTSVLASMQRCFEDVSQDTNLMLNTADNETLDVIEQKRREMQKYFFNKDMAFEPDSNPTLALTTYGFDLDLHGKKGHHLGLNFIDYPGEWLSPKASPSEKDELNKYMKTSHILVVAIDTPYMMEEEGKYNDDVNFCYRITEMIKKSGFADKENLILFVPLKCERYYREEKMTLVHNKICKVYETLIQVIQAGGKCAAAITPILTLGGAEFSRFARNENGDLILREGTDIPDKAIYYFPDASVKEPEPKYCEQPLFYILAYALRMAKKAKEDKKGSMDALFQWFQTELLKWPSAADYGQEFDRIRSKMKTSGNGYCILTKSSWLRA